MTKQQVHIMCNMSVSDQIIILEIEDKLVVLFSLPTSRYIVVKVTTTSYYFLRVLTVGTCQNP